jgi:anti-anti-sigma factor
MAEGSIEMGTAGSVCVIDVLGEHDISTHPSLQDAIERAVLEEPAVCVDLTRTEFIDSTAIRALITGHQLAGERDEPTRYALVAPAGGGFVRDVLEMVDLTRFLAVYDTRAEAVAALEDAGAAPQR